MVESTNTPHADHTSLWPEVWEPLKQLGERVAGFFTPAADAANTTSTYELRIELPGVEAKDVVIELHDRLLSVKGEKHARREESGKHFFFSERRYGSFHRAFRLPDKVRSEDIKADFKDGVLTIAVPKVDAGAEGPSRIPISS